MIGGGLFRTSPVLTNSNTLATIGCSRFIKTYSTETGKLLSSVHAHSSLIVAIHKNPFSDLYVISTSQDGEVKCWSLKNRRLVLVKSWNLQARIHQSKLPNSRSNDSMNLYVLTLDGHRLFIKKYELKMNYAEGERMNVKVVTKIYQPKKLANFVSFEISDDENHLIWVGRSYLYVLNITSSRKPRRKLLRLEKSESYPTCLTFHSPSKTIAIGTATGHIKIFTLPQFLYRTSHWHPVEVKYLMFSEDGSCLYSGGRSGVLLSQNLEVSNIGNRFVFLRDYPIVDFIISPSLDLYLIRTEENLVYIVRPSRYNQAHLGRSAISHRLVGLLPKSGKGQFLVSCPPTFREVTNPTSNDDEDEDQDQEQPNVQFYQKQVMVVGHTFHKMQWYDLSKDIEGHHEMLFFHRKSFDSREHGFLNRKLGKQVQMTHISFCRDVFNERQFWYVHAEKIRPGKFLRESVNIKIWFRKSEGYDDDNNNNPTKRRRRRRMKGEDRSKYRVVSVIDRPHGEKFDVTDLLTLPTPEEGGRKMFASSGSDGTVRMWKYVGGEEEKKIRKMIEEEENKKKKEEEETKNQDIIIVDEEDDEEEKKKKEEIEYFKDEDEDMYDTEEKKKYKNDGYFQCVAILKYQNLVPCSLLVTRDGATLFILFEHVLTIWNVENCRLIYSVKIPTSSAKKKKKWKKRRRNKLIHFTESKIGVWCQEDSGLLFFFDHQKTCSFSPPFKIHRPPKDQQQQGKEGVQEVKIKDIDTNPFIWMNQKERKDLLLIVNNNNNNENRRSIKNGEFLIVLKNKKYLSLVREMMVQEAEEENNKCYYEVKKIDLKNIIGGGREVIESATYLSETQICVLTNHSELLHFDIQSYETNESSVIEIEYHKDSKLVEFQDEDEEVEEEGEDVVMMDKSKKDDLLGPTSRRRKKKRVKFNPDKGLGGWKELFPPNSHSISSLSSVYESYMQNFIIGK